MSTVSIRARLQLRPALLAAIALGMTTLTAAQAASISQKPVTTLEKDFFAALRSGSSSRVLSYIPEGGVDVGPDAQHETRDQIEQQFRSHRALYCKLFDSACIDAKIALDAGARSCSYRELLTHSEKVRTPHPARSLATGCSRRCSWRESKTRSALIKS